MVKLILYVLIMLTLTKKPYNPNKKYDGYANTNKLTTAASDWDKSDICGILHNIQTISQKDITITGNDYSVTSSKYEIVAELIATMNCGHYNVLCGMRDIIKQNNSLINITENRNKSVDYCLKKMKQIEIKLSGLHLLLTQTLQILPDMPLNDFQSIMKAKNIIDDIAFNGSDSKPRIDTNIIQPTHPTINGSPEQTIELETTQNNCASENLCTNMRGQINLLNEPQSNHNIINKITITTTTDTIDDPHINPFDETQSKDPIIYERNDQIINGSPEQTIDMQTTQSNCVSTNPNAILGAQINRLNEPQSNHITINTITTSSTTDMTDDVHINKLDETQSKKDSLTKSSVLTRDTKKIINQQLKLKNKPKIKIKKKKKKIKIKNKRNKKKKIKQKKKMMNISVKNNILHLELEQLVKSEFTDDDYQNWMNIRLFNPEYTATTYYKKTYGTSAINKIKQSHVNDQ